MVTHRHHHSKRLDVHIYLKDKLPQATSHVAQYNSVSFVANTSVSSHPNAGAVTCLVQTLRSNVN